MKTLFKVLTYVVFPLLIILLVYLVYDSVMQPVRFQKEVDRREAVFYKNGKITIVRQIGSMDDSIAVAEGRVSRDSIEIMVRDTLLKGKGAMIDSISFIPFSGGKRIHMESVIRKVSGIEIPLFEATMSYDDLLKGLDRQLVVNLKAEKEDMGQYPGLKVGDINNPNNNAGNWE